MVLSEQDTQSTLFSQKQDVSNINIVMKIMYLAGHLYNCYIAHVFGYMINDYSLLVKMNQRLLNKLRYCKFVVTDSRHISQKQMDLIYLVHVQCHITVTNEPSSA